MNIQSSDVHEKDQFCFLSEDDSETEEDIWDSKQAARKEIYSKPNLPTELGTEAQTPDLQPDNLPLVCNNIQGPDQDRRRQLRNEDTFPRSLRPHQDQDPVL